MKELTWNVLSGENPGLWEALFNSLWQGMILVAAVWLVLLAFPRLNAATRYAAWYATLLALVLLPFVSGRFVGYSAPATPDPAFAVETRVPSGKASPPLALRATTAVTASNRNVSDRIAGAHRTPAAEPIPVKADPPKAEPPWAVRVNSGLWLALIGVVWLCVVAWKGLRLLGSVRSIRQIKSRAEVMQGDPGVSWKSWRAHSRRGSRVWLGWSEEIGMPGVFGFVRPAILFPHKLKGQLSEDEMEQVALHELAHVARFDDWWQVVQRVVESVLFFHPAVRFVSKRLALEREIACDDWVLHRVGRPREYAGCLARLAEQPSALPLPVPGAALSKKHIVRRIEMLLSRNRSQRPGSSRVVTLLAALWLAVAVVQIGFVRPLVAVTAPEASPALEPAPTPASAPHVERATEPREAPTASPVPFARVETSPAPAHQSTQPGVETSVLPVSVRWAQAAPPRPPQPPVPPRTSYQRRATPQPPAPPAPPATPATPAPPAPPAKRKGFSSEHSHDGTSITINRDGDETTWLWSDGYYKVRIEMDGEVEFEPSGAGIRRISSDGYFIVRERERGKVRELEVVPGRRDTLEYFYFEDDEPLPYDDTARRWFTKLLPDLMRETGLGAKERVAALLKDGGTAAVLDEVSRVSSDYVKRIYFVELLNSGSLKQEDLRSIFREAGRQFDSDYEMAELLIEYAGKVGGDAATLDAFVFAVGEMDSDYEVRRVLTALAEHEPMSQSQAEAVLKLAWGMDSDYEKAELLLDLVEFSRDDPALRSLYVEAVAGMESDYEIRRVLEELLETRHADEAFVTQVLDVTTSMDSDYEQAELLISLAELAEAEDAALSGYIRAAARIGSDYEARRVLSAISWREGLPEAVYLDLLQVVSQLDSDYEKAEFLLEHHEVFASSDAVQDAFDRAIDSIGSDYERSRVEAAFYRATRKSGSRGGSY